MLTTGVNQESETDQDHETGVELPLGHPKDTLGIWLTHIFHQDAGESVEDEKEPRDRSMDQLGKTNPNEIENTKDVLVYMQVDKNSYSRRGLRSLKYDTYPYFLMYKNKITNIFELFVGLSIRFTYCTYCSIRSIIKL